MATNEAAAAGAFRKVREQQSNARAVPVPEHSVQQSGASATAGAGLRAAADLKIRQGHNVDFPQTLRPKPPQEASGHLTTVVANFLHKRMLPMVDGQALTVSLGVLTTVHSARQHGSKRPAPGCNLDDVIVLAATTRFVEYKPLALIPYVHIAADAAAAAAAAKPDDLALLAVKQLCDIVDAAKPASLDGLTSMEEIEQLLYGKVSKLEKAVCALCTLGCCRCPTSACRNQRPNRCSTNS